MGTKAVLVGGSAAAVYAPESLRSRDADFILTFVAGNVETEDTLRTIGYRRAGRIFAHESQLVTLDFPDDVIYIGEEWITAYDTIERGSFKLNIITPYDCIRDRLLSYFAWSDRSALLAAVEVARRQAFDAVALQTWANAQNESARYAEFLRRIERG